MSKKDKSQVIDPTAETVVDEAAAEKLAKFKEAKKEAAKRHKEKVAAQKNATIEGANESIKILKENNLWDSLPDSVKQYFVAQSQLGTSSGNEPVFAKLFGDNPQVGDSITIRDVFQKTLKGKSNMDNLVKKWAEKGIVISYAANAEDITLSTYTIESLGA